MACLTNFLTWIFSTRNKSFHSKRLGGFLKPPAKRFNFRPTMWWIHLTLILTPKNQTILYFFWQQSIQQTKEYGVAQMSHPFFDLTTPLLPHFRTAAPVEWAQSGKNSIASAARAVHSKWNSVAGHGNTYIINIAIYCIIVYYHVLYHGNTYSIIIHGNIHIQYLCKTQC